MNPRSAEGAEHESAKTSSRTTRDVKAMITCCGGYVPIEIVSVAFFIAFIISVPISQMYIYNEIAEEHGIHNFVKQDEHPCDNGSTIDNTTLAIQKEASTQFMYISLTSSLPSFIPTLFLGSIADKYSRKAAMLMTFTGLLIKNLIYVLVIQAKLSYKLLYLGNAVEGFSGYYGAVTMAAFGVIADITTPGKQRGLRIALMEAVTATSLAVFQLLAGIAIKYVDFVYPMLVATFFNILAIGLCVIFLPDTLHGQRYPIFKTLSFRYVARSFQFYIKETPTKRRSKLILLLFIALITFAAGFGTSSTNALFVFNRPFCWSEIHFTIFDFVRTVIKWICSVMLVFVVHKFIVQNKDIELIIIGSVSYFASFIMFGTAITSWMLYISAVLGAVSLVSIPITRSIMSRLVKADEQGSLFAGIACIDMLATTLSGVLYSGIYKDTVGFYSGMVYLLMSALFVVVVVLTIVLKRKMEEVEWKPLENAETQH